MAVGKYPPGTIRYIDYIGQDGKTYTKKQKYYWLKLNIPNDGTWSGFASVYKEGWITGIGGYPHPPYFEYYKDFSNKFTVYYLPDASIKLKDTTFGLYVKENTFKADYYELKDDIIYYNNLYSGEYIAEDLGDAIDSVPDGQQFNFKYIWEYAVGESYCFGWAELIKKSDSEETESSAPSALDNDWTLEQVEEKIKDLQLWSDNNLLPPIFGPTNCVYFPSDLGSTKPDKPQDTNPIIKSHPFKGSIGIQNTDIYVINGINYNKYYDMDYPISFDFQQIKCQKDEEFTINCKFPFIYTYERFDVIQDTYLYESTDDDSPGGSPPPNKTYLTFESFKVNQIVEIRFIQPDALGAGNTNSLLFNKYKMQAIITKSDVPTDTVENASQWTKKYSISFKFINDLGLKPDEYFSAKVVVTGFPVRNYVQNETYCIKRYYNKILGLGPRLGGSVIITNQSSFDSEPIHQTNNILFTALKDEEKLNKPYEDVSISMNYFNINYPYSLANYDLTHEFSEQDLPGQFIPLGGYLIDKEDKKYIERYRSYLIKNLDEHTYEEYRNLKLGAESGLVVFRESNENADLTFGSY